MTDKYTVLDAAILTQLKEGTYSFTELNYSSDIFVELKALTKKHNEGLNSFRRHKLPFRFLDGRLQALRKKGLIEFSDAKWKLKADS